MINLLPPELKQEYQYARYNRRLIHWVTAFVFVIFGVAIITMSGLVVMGNSVDSYTSQIAASQSQLATQNTADVQAQVTSISNNLKLMVNVLSQEILFSKLLDQLGSVTPSNVVLTNLTIAQNESAVDITAQAANYGAAAQLQTNLADPNNQIFSKADLISITCNTPQTAYPCTTTIRALFTTNNPFLFINAAKKGTP